MILTTTTTTSGQPSSRRINGEDDTKTNTRTNNNDNSNSIGHGHGSNNGSNSNSNSNSNSPNLSELRDDITMKQKSIRDGRKQSRKRKQLLSASTSITAIAIVCIYWYGFIWRTQHIMESFLRDRTLWQDLQTHLEPSPIYPEKFIYFQPISSGQGAGNVISGLLAAHLFGEEFGRVVCVSGAYADFLAAFEPTNAQAIRACPNLPGHGPPSTSLSLYNFGSIPNECALADVLNSSTTVLYLTGNTYPRWPKVPDDFFLRYYRPTPALLQMLPWDEPPHTVVHLRMGDNGNDLRKGLDDETLDALGEMLPHDTFLVSNEVTWYHRFARKYSWRNAGWHAVKHSALDSVEWSKTNVEHDVNNMQLWSDWYTVLMAKQVVHTHSDFSISAIHWMNIKDTKTVMGIKYVGMNGKTEKVLDLIDESWRRDGETIPLRDRNRVNVSVTDNDMRLCTAPLGFMAGG